MKKLVCLCLAAAVVAALAAGCSTNVDIGPTTVPTPSTISDDELNQAMSNLGGENLEDLDEAARKALEDQLREQGVLIEGVTIPVSTNAPATLPAAMPSGSKADNSEVYGLVENIHKIFSSGNYVLKARGSAPLEGTSGMTNSPMTIAMTKDGKSMVEFEIDWTTTMKAMAEAEGTNKNQAVIQAATAQTLWGKKLRFINMDGESYIVFVEKKTYFPMSAFEEEGEDMGGMDVAGAFSEAFVPQGDLNADVASSKVKLDGKEYLCATIEKDGTSIRYYFLNKELKRIEMQADGTTSIILIDQLSGTVDNSLFNLKGYTKMDLKQLASMGDSLGALFGAS